MDTVTFGTKNSYTDFGLILSSKSVSLPKPKTKTVEVPGADGELDLTDVLTDEVKYSNRKLQFTFTVIDHFNGWAARLSQVTNYLHGQKMKIVMDWDNQYYYRGRCEVNSFKSQKRLATIVIDVDAEPWKYEMNSLHQQWEWDDFNFINGVIQTNEYQINKGITNINLIVGRKIAFPTIKCNVSMDVNINNQIYKIYPGTNLLKNAKLHEGQNLFIFDSPATSDVVEITWEGGSL